MTDLSRLVEAPACSLLPYIDPAFPNHPLLLHAARPRNYDVGTPVLFVHYGVGRNGRDCRDYWPDLVDEAGILAISIEFPEASFPEHLWYHFGNLHDKDGTPNRSEEWTFGIDERLFDQLRAQGVTTRRHDGLFGHSAGGQFVHRMVSFGFRDRVAIAVNANAGTYAMPDLATPWPFGLGQTDIDSDALRALLGFRVTVMRAPRTCQPLALLPKKGARVRSIRRQPAVSARVTAFNSVTQPRRRCRPAVPGL